MKVALMQPYYFPYIGYFDLIASSDAFVFYDDAAFSKNSWYNRNRILAQNKEWEYIRVSVKHAPLGTSVNEIALQSKEADFRRTMDLLRLYRRAPYYRPVCELVSNVFETTGSELSSIASGSIKATADYLGFRADFRYSSTLDYDQSENALGKVLSICKSVGATQYVNLSGGRTLYDDATFLAQGIALSFTNPVDLIYPVSNEFTFVPGLSVIDVLMWCSPAYVRAYLDARKI